MSEPRVMAMCLTADRPQFIDRAVTCFKAQSYENKVLLIYDTGKEPIPSAQFAYNGILSGHDAQGIYYEYHPEDRGLTIGALRNLSMAFAHPLCLDADIVAHFDSDDWSHSNRIAEQVVLLGASGTDCVGYNEILVWQSPRIPCPVCNGKIVTCPHCIMYPKLFDAGEAWLYSLPRSNYALGTSLCYWRKTWEKKPFQDTNAGEDLRFIEGLNVKGVSAMTEPSVDSAHAHPIGCPCGHCDGKGSVVMTVTISIKQEPRMITSVHGGNTYLRIDPQEHEPEHLRQWKRVSEWDEALCSIMALTR